MRDGGDPSEGGRSSPQKEGMLKANTQMRLAFTLIVALRLSLGRRPSNEDLQGNFNSMMRGDGTVKQARLLEAQKDFAGGAREVKDCAYTHTGNPS